MNTIEFAKDAAIEYLEACGYSQVEMFLECKEQGITYEELVQQIIDAKEIQMEKELTLESLVF